MFHVNVSWAPEKVWQPWWIQGFETIDTTKEAIQSRWVSIKKIGKSEDRLTVTKINADLNNSLLT